MIRTLALAVALVAPAAASAEVVRLNEIEARALKARPELDETRLAIRKADAELEQARTGYYPEIAATADVGAEPGGKTVTVNDANSDKQFLVQGSESISDPESFVPGARYGVTLGMRGPIWDFGRTSTRVKAAELKRVAADADERSENDRLTVMVRGAYLHWLTAFELRGTAEKTVQAAQTRRQRVESAVKEGARPGSDLAPARSGEAAAQLDAARAHAELDDARHTIETLIGEPLPTTAEPDATILDTPPDAVLPPDDPQVKSLRANQDALAAASEMLDDRYVPDLTAEVGIGVRGQQANIFPAYRVSIPLAIPLWDGGLRESKASVTRIESRSLGAAAERIQRERQRAVTRAREARANLDAQIEAARDLEQAADTRLKEAEERYDLGSGTIEAIDEARSARVRAETEILRVRLERYRQSALLE